MGEHKDEHKKKSGVTWGMLLAGAAIATGAVLFAPTLLTEELPALGSNLLEGLKSIGGSIGEFITGLFKPGAGGSLASAINTEGVKKLAGAALVGSGVVYFMNKKDEPHAEEHSHREHKSFTHAEDMRLMQGKMLLQAAAAGNPQAQAMLAQQQRGR